MKLLIKLIVMFLIIQCIYCKYNNRTRRSLNFIDNISNKTLTVANKVVKTARGIKDNVVSTVYNFVADKKTKIKNKMMNYIDAAEKAASTIYDQIAPEQIDYECSNDDPANHMTTPQLITLHGYFSESHVIPTQDGYLLTVHRIPYSRKSSSRKSPNKTILLHHGLLGSSADWVLASPRTSLGFILSDAGYDVWMANVRGNVYSRAHVSRSFDSDAFWNFTFHEVAQYDLPAVIDYIIDKKGDVKINYVGFSMGTTVLFAMLSTKTQYNNVLGGAFALAPVAYMTRIKSPLKVLSKFGNTMQRFLKLVGANEFLPRNAAVRYLAKHSCQILDFDDAMCEISMFLMCGHNKEHFDRSLIPTIFGHVPAGASTKTLVHYSQEIKNDGKFQQYDYGVEGNIVQYGSETPPEYPLHRITLPISLLSAKDDWLSSLTDAIKLFTELSHPVEHYIVPDKTFNHLDFVFARDAHSLVYDKLLIMLEKSSF